MLVLALFTPLCPPALEAALEVIEGRGDLLIAGLPLLVLQHPVELVIGQLEQNERMVFAVDRLDLLLHDLETGERNGINQLVDQRGVLLIDRFTSSVLG